MPEIERELLSYPHGITTDIVDSMLWLSSTATRAMTRLIVGCRMIKRFIQPARTRSKSPTKKDLIPAEAPAQTIIAAICRVWLSREGDDSNRARSTAHQLKNRFIAEIASPA